MQLIGSEPYIPHDLFLEAINVCYNATSVNALSPKINALIDFKAAFVYHLPLIGAHDSDHIGRFWARGLSAPIVKYLESQKSLDEPIRHYVMSKGRPFWLSQLDDKSYQWNEDATKRINMALTRLGDGIVAPSFGPFHRRAYYYMSFNKPTEFYDEIFLLQMQALLQALQVKYCLIVESLRTNIKLTPRESEVLELITFGKTNPEIGKTLGITSNTVTGYVKQIFLKLGVSDRVSAAIRARSHHI